MCVVSGGGFFQGFCLFLLVIVFTLLSLLLFGFLQSSLAAARADNFYYPPEWTPNQVCLIYSLHIFVGTVYDWSVFGILMFLCFSGFSEQVPWSTCSEGEGKKNRPGYFDYKVINKAYPFFITFLLVYGSQTACQYWEDFYVFFVISCYIC